MSAVPEMQQTGNLGDVKERLDFSPRLQAVTNKIHATSNVDEIMLDLSQDVVMRILAAGEPIPLDKLGILPHNPRTAQADHRKALRTVFRLRPDRVRKNDDPAFGPASSQHAGHQDLDRGRPGGNHPERIAPGAGEPQGGAGLCNRHARIPARRSGCDHGRRDARQGNRVDRPGSVPDRPPGICDAPHEQRPGIHRPLLDMGMDPFNFADALLGILAQRLAKRLCAYCRQPYRPDEGELKRLLTEYCEELMHTEAFLKDPKSAQQEVLNRWTEQYAGKDGQFTLYRAVGCEQCAKGYKGRVGLHALMVGTDRVKRLLQEKARVAQLLAAALEDGMLTLKMDGIENVLAGATDIGQVRQVCIK